MSEAKQAVSSAADGTADGRERVIFPAAVLVATGIGTLTLGIVFYASEVHGATPAQIGFLAATWSFHYILGCLLVRPLSERVRPARSIVGAAGAMGLSVLAVLCLRHLAGLFVCYGVYGIATAFFWPPLMGWLSTGREGARLNRTMGWFNLSWSTGAILGPVLAGTLARHDVRLPVAAAAGFYLVAAVYALWSTRHRPGPPPVTPRRSVDGRLPPEEDHSTPLRFLAWVGLFAAYAALAVTISVFPLAAQAQMGLSKPQVGVLMFVRSLFTTLALGVLGRTTVWHFRPGQMVTGLILYAAAMAWLPQAASAAAAGAVLAVIGALLAQSYANSLFHGVAGSPRRAPRMAAHEALLSAGLVVGGAAGGVVYQSMGYGAVCRAAAGVLAAAAIGVLAAAWALRRRPSTPDGQ